MKVALLTDGIYPFVLGGMQRHSFFLAQNLAKSGVHVLLVHPDTGRSTEEFLSHFSSKERDFIEVIQVPFVDKGKVPGHYVRASYKYSKSVYDAIKGSLSEIDFIYAKGFCAWHTIKMKKRGLVMPPVGVKFHGYEMFQRQASLRGRMESRLLRRPTAFNNLNADIVFSYGGKITELITGLGVSPDKVVEIPSGIEGQWIEKNIRPTERPLRFVFIGRFERRKGIKEIHNAIRSMERSIRFQFDIIGPIPHDQRIDDPRVQYHGQLDRKEDVNTVLRSSDILMCPSYSEGMPNVILEGMANGLAIFSTDVGATSMLVSDANGWLISDLGQIEASIKDLLERSEQIDPSDIDRKKETSLRKVQEFTWEEISEKTIQEIRRMIK